MIWFNLLLNICVFLIIMNLSSLTKWYKTKQPIQLNPWLGIALPVSLGLALTGIDSLRLYFLYQILIFVGIAAVFTWLFFKLAKRNHD